MMVGSVFEKFSLSLSDSNFSANSNTNYNGGELSLDGSSLITGCNFTKILRFPVRWCHLHEFHLSPSMDAALLSKMMSVPVDPMEEPCILGELECSNFQFFIFKEYASDGDLHPWGQ